MQDQTHPIKNRLTLWLLTSFFLFSAGLFGCEEAGKGRQCQKDTDCAYGTCNNGYCVCPEPLRICALRCVNLQEDAEHCGACGQTCPSGQACQSGQCKPICPDEHILCSDQCILTNKDIRHCGACDKACREEQSCTDGGCLCPTGLTDCDGTCTDTFAHGKHCGACGQACPAGQVCSEGRCTATCPEPTPSLCFGGCTDLQTNPLHCGQCGKRCPIGFLCEQGRCRCPDGQTECEGRCVELQSDALHCGACGQRCPKGKVCGGGQCLTSCPEATPTTCFGGCVDTKANSLHCGKCGASCFPGGRCTEQGCLCSSGLERCNNRCVDLSSDEEHCGACGTTCAPTERCQNGACVLVCPPQQKVCNGFCVTTQEDPQHCGACGKTCSGGQACTQGVCGGCPAGQNLCDGRCAQLQTDPQHCGSCNVACPNGQFCVGGSCAPSCPVERPTPCGGRCVDLQVETAHCGVCNKACADKERCNQGTCEPICELGLQACAGTCADLKTSVLHCGACGTACKNTERCVEGKCVDACGSGTTLCNDRCVDLQTNPLHCGQCSITCKNKELCAAGTCKVDCAADGRTDCNGTCIDLLSDTNHCGACGKACAANQACAGGTCVDACPPILPKRCDKSCVDIFADANHCGGCNQACAEQERCNNGSCVCFTGLSRCGKACVNLLSDARNCGGCGLSCPAGQRCANGLCTLQCPTDLPHTCVDSCVDLNKDFFRCGSCNRTCSLGETCVQGQCLCAGSGSRCSGRCTDLLNDRYHCGQCGRACGVDEDCQQGTCKAVCPTGEVVCGKTCVNLLTDTGNCGQCGNLCKSDQRCTHGVCQPKCNIGLSLCNGTCVNLKGDDAHCGACGSACKSGERCINGQCTALCVTGLVFCSGSCVNLTSNNAHCGACGVACSLNQTCTQSSCLPTCSGSLTLCGAECANLQDNPNHCGACGQSCQAGYLCSGGSCVPPCRSFETFCGGLCNNVETDPFHCGACNNACTLGQSCVQGQCYVRPVVDTFTGVPQSRDGKGNYATFTEPLGITVDPAGNVYVTDRSAHLIRKIDTNGRISTIAGNGTQGTFLFPVDARTASLDRPTGIFFDPYRNLLAFSANPSNFQHLIVLIGTTLQSTLAFYGNVNGSAALDRVPTLSANILDGYVYAHTATHCVQWNYYVRNGNVSSPQTKRFCTGVAGFNDGPADQAQFNAPQGVVFDQKTGKDIYVADTLNHVIRKISNFSTVPVVSTFAGTRFPGNLNGTGAQAQFNEPVGLVQDSVGNLFVVDRKNHSIRKIDTTGNVTTHAGTGVQGYTDGPANQAQFNNPNGLAIDQTGNLYVADTGNRRIRKIDTTGNVTTLAGNGAGLGSDNGPRELAKLNNPSGIARDNAGNYYISDANSRIRKIDTNGQVTVFSGSSPGMADGDRSTAKFQQPQGVHVIDSEGALYVSDSQNHRVRKIVLSTGVTSTFAGDGLIGLVDGASASARFNYPTAVSIYKSGASTWLAVADTNNHTIRRIALNGTTPNTVSTFAGNGTIGFNDGFATSARFNLPRGLAWDGNATLYVADTGNHCIRAIPSSQVVSTHLGSCGNPGYVDGFRTYVRMSSPQDLAFDSAGNLWFLDAGNQVIRKYAGNSASTVAGVLGKAGFADGLGSKALFNFPTSLVIDNANTLHIVDQKNNLVRRVFP